MAGASRSEICEKDQQYLLMFQCQQGHLQGKIKQTGLSTLNQKKVNAITMPAIYQHRESPLCHHTDMFSISKMFLNQNLSM